MRQVVRFDSLMGIKMYLLMDVLLDRYELYIGLEHHSLCNDNPFYVVILEGYSVAGLCHCSVGSQYRMSGCLGSLALCSRLDGGGPVDNTWESVSLYGALIVSRCYKYTYKYYNNNVICGAL